MNQMDISLSFQGSFLGCNSQVFVCLLGRGRLVVGSFCLYVFGMCGILFMKPLGNAIKAVDPPFLEKALM